MKIKLYTNIYEDACREYIKCIDLEIKKMTISYTYFPATPEEINSYSYENSNRRFDYDYDNFYLNIFPDLKLNTKIIIRKMPTIGDDSFIYVDDGSTIGGVSGYCHLNTFQRFILNWNFKKTWLQNSENFRFLINILIAILVAYITAKFTK